MDLQNRDGNLAKTEILAPFISDLKVECTCRTAQSKSSSTLFFTATKTVSALQDFSRDSTGFLLPDSA